MRFFATTDTGKLRKQNEDFLFASDHKTGALPNLFIVADGMGGHNAGEVASELCVKCLVEDLRDSLDGDPKASLKHAIERANAMVLSKARSDAGKEGMGTTLVCCSIFPDHLLVASIGDSRLYIKDGEDFTKITRDHTVVEEMLRLGSISKSSAATHPKRHMLTRAVGVMDEVLIDFFEIPVKGEEKILLATDGLTNMISEESLSALVSYDSDIEASALKMLETAIENGGEDNITLILVDLKR